MKCKSEYCIYNKNSACVYDDIKINASGMCDSCGIVTIPEKELEKHKNRSLEEIDKIWGKYGKSFF